MRILIALPLLVLPSIAGEKSPSAFRLGKDENVKTTVDLKEVFPGTRARNPRDAIPAIDNPGSIPAAKASWLEPDDRVLGLVVNGEARAYPLRILEGHEMVNDVLGGQPVGPNY